MKVSLTEDEYSHYWKPSINVNTTDASLGHICTTLSNSSGYTCSIVTDDSFITNTVGYLQSLSDDFGFKSDHEKQCIETAFRWLRDNGYITEEEKMTHHSERLNNVYTDCFHTKVGEIAVVLCFDSDDWRIGVHVNSIGIITKVMLFENGDKPQLLYGE